MIVHLSNLLPRYSDPKSLIPPPPPLDSPVNDLCRKRVNALYFGWILGMKIILFALTNIPTLILWLICCKRLRRNQVNETRSQKQTFFASTEASFDHILFFFFSLFRHSSKINNKKTVEVTSNITNNRLHSVIPAHHTKNRWRGRDRTVDIPKHLFL